MICLELNWFFFGPSWMLQISEKVAIKGAYFSPWAYTPLPFFANTPLKTKPEESSIYQALVERIKMKINLRTWIDGLSLTWVGLEVYSLNPEPL